MCLGVLSPMVPLPSMSLEPCATWINFTYLVYYIEALLIATGFLMNTHQPLLYLVRLQTI